MFCFDYLFFFFISFLLFLMTSVYSYLKGVTAFLTRRSVTPRQQAYSCRWSFWRLSLWVRCVPVYIPKKKDPAFSRFMNQTAPDQHPKGFKGIKMRYGNSCHQPSRVNAVKLQTLWKDVQSTTVLSLLICCMKSQRKIFIFLFYLICMDTNLDEFKVKKEVIFLRL